MIEYLLSPSVVHALGWTLVHSLWQAGLFALLLGALLLVLRNYSAHARYLVCVGVLAGFILTAVLTFTTLCTAPPASGPSVSAAVPVPTDLLVSPDPAPASAQTTSLPMATTGSFYERMINYYDTHLPLFVTVWLLGVLVLQLRFLGQLAYLQRLKTYGTVALDARLQPLLTELETALGLTKPVRYLSSLRIASPLTFGWLRPVVLFPTTLLEQLREPELRTLFAHELAHVRRHDFPVNLVQTLCCMLFFYHPAVWWMSARTEDEREHACDDLTVSVTGERIGYAKTLLQLKEAELSPSLAMAATGRAGGFQGRIKRLLSGYLGTGTFGEGFTSAALIFGIMVMAISLSGRQSTGFVPETPNEVNAAAEAGTTERDNFGANAENQARGLLMLKAAEDGDLYVLEDLIRQGVDVNTANVKNAVSYTPLMAAASENQVEAARLLIKHGADVNARHNDGWTPLIIAAGEDSYGVMQLLIDAGADLDFVNRNNWTALIEAADEDALRSAELLLEAGAQVDIPGLPRSALTMAASEGHPEMIGLLVKYGADIKALKNLNTPLHAAAEENHPDIVKTLIEKGADVNRKDKHGRTPLSYAAEEGNTSIVRYLLEQGADPHVVDNEGLSALHFAAEEGNARIVDLLLARGGGDNFRTREGVDVRTSARRN